MSPFSFLCSTFAALPPHWSASALTKSATQFRVLLSGEPLLKADQVIKNLLKDGPSSLDNFSEKYKLDELYKMQDCKLEPNKPERAAMEYVYHCLKDVDDVNPEGFKFNQIVPSWERLAPFISTSIQRPDVSITNASGDCILTAEVHSGSGHGDCIQRGDWACDSTARSANQIRHTISGWVCFP